MVTWKTSGSHADSFVFCFVSSSALHQPSTNGLTWTLTITRYSHVSSYCSIGWTGPPMCVCVCVCVLMRPCRQRKNWLYSCSVYYGSYCLQRSNDFQSVRCWPGSNFYWIDLSCFADSKSTWQSNCSRNSEPTSMLVRMLSHIAIVQIGRQDWHHFLFSLFLRFDRNATRNVQVNSTARTGHYPRECDWSVTIW